jgi:hypothetical protein
MLNLTIHHRFKVIRTKTKIAIERALRKMKIKLQIFRMSTIRQSNKRERKE